MTTNTHATNVVSVPPYDGVNYVGDVYGSYADASSLSSLAGDNVDAVALTADFGIDAQNSTVYDNDVAGGYTESDAHIGATIASAVSLDLSVMVRPLLDFLPSNYETAPNQTNPKNGSYSANEWRTYYKPANVSAFFASYQSMIVQEATLAQANGATLFCIGTELDGIAGAAYESYWDTLIAAVRQVFAGKLTYGADWDDALSPWQYGGSGLSAGTGNLATQISFWNKLDYVGIDEYAPISDLANPTVAQLVDGWTQTPTDSTAKAVTGNQSLIAYYQGVAATVGKPLLFTELGYANSSDADSSPATPGYDENGNPDHATADASLQANLYQAFFDAWKQDGNGTLAGTYFWNWEPDAASVGPGHGINFSVQGQPAEAVLAGGYCFVSGTRIATPGGEMAVEHLRVGDLVLTADRGMLPVRWLGVQTVAARFADPLRLPVRIRAGALGKNSPCRDLLVSPGHALFLDGVLVQAGALVNGTSIVRAHHDRQARWRYYHIELDRHALLVAEGVAAESFMDGAEPTAFDNAATRPARDPVEPMPYPRVQAQRQVPAFLRARLAARAAA